MRGLAAPTCFETFTMVEDRKLTQLGKNADLRTWNARDSETNFVDFFQFWVVHWLSSMVYNIRLFFCFAVVAVHFFQCFETIREPTTMFMQTTHL